MMFQIVILALMLNAIDAITMKDQSLYFKCKGKTTGMEAYYAGKASMMAECAAKAQKNCFYMCVYQSVGVFDEETGKFSREGTKKFYDYSSMDEDLKAKVVDTFEKCYDGLDLVNNGRCQSFRAGFYCHHNEYLKLCGGDRKPKDVNVQSEEVSAGLDLLDTAGQARNLGGESKKLTYI